MLVPTAMCFPALHPNTSKTSCRFVMAPIALCPATLLPNESADSRGANPTESLALTRLLIVTRPCLLVFLLLPLLFLPLPLL